MVLKAVAENQPQCPVAHAVEHQNRMSFYRPFEPLVTRLREFIRTSGARVGHETAPGGGSPDHFETLTRELFELQNQHNPAYARICAHMGKTPDRMSRWHDLPFVPTQSFKDLELTSLPPGLRSHVFHSSGTTGQTPSRHFHSSESLAIYELSLLTWFKAHLSPGQTRLRLLPLTPAPDAAPHSSLVHMFDTLGRELSASPAPFQFLGKVDEAGGWQLDLPSIDTALAAACDAGEPVWLMGTAFNFVHWADTLTHGRRRFQLPPGSKVMETGGYKGRSRSLPKEELHGLLADRLGVGAHDILCEYGMSELSSQAYDWPVNEGESRRREFRFPPWARCRVISPETGREADPGSVGILQILDLANVFSVMAIQTEDLVRRAGDAFQWVGRASDAESRGCSLMSTAS